MSLGNRIMLITYPDSLGRNLRELRYILHEHLCGVVGGLHILPFTLAQQTAVLHPLTTGWWTPVSAPMKTSSR